MLEVHTHVEWVIVKFFPVPTPPETVFFDGWLRTAEEKFYALPEMPFYLADTPAESLQVRAGNNFSGNKVRGSVTAEQSQTARFMADGNFNNKVMLEYAGKAKLKHLEIVINSENAFAQELGKNICNCKLKAVNKCAGQGFVSARLHWEYG